MTGVQDSYGHDGNGPTIYRWSEDDLSQHKLLRDNDDRRLRVSSCLWTCPEVTLCVAWWCELWNGTAGWSCKKTLMHSFIYPPNVCTASTVFHASPKATRVHYCPPGGCRAEKATWSCWPGQAKNCSAQQSGSVPFFHPVTPGKNIWTAVLWRENKGQIYFSRLKKTSICI